MRNRCLFQAALPQRPETHIRFAESCKRNPSFLYYVLLLHRIALLAAGDGLLPVPPQAGRQHPVNPVNPV